VWTPSDHPSLRFVGHHSSKEYERVREGLDYVNMKRGGVCGHRSFLKALVESLADVELSLAYVDSISEICTSMKGPLIVFEMLSFLGWLL